MAFLKISTPLSFINTYQMNLISAGSISLDNTLKVGHEVDTASKSRVLRLPVC
jgi:hypothetical protein